MVNQRLMKRFMPKRAVIAKIGSEPLELPNYSGVAHTLKSIGVTLGIITKTSAYTVKKNDHTILCNGTFTVTLPGAGTVNGIIYNIKNIGTGTITVDGNASETIDGGATATLNAQFESISIHCDGSNWHII